MKLKISSVSSNWKKFQEKSTAKKELQHLKAKTVIESNTNLKRISTNYKTNQKASVDIKNINHKKDNTKNLLMSKKEVKVITDAESEKSKNNKPKKSLEENPIVNSDEINENYDYLSEKNLLLCVLNEVTKDYESEEFIPKFNSNCSGNIANVEADENSDESDSFFNTENEHFNNNTPILKLFKSFDKIEGCKVSKSSKQKVGKYVGIDCEMVGVGESGVKSILARVSIINYFGVLIYDEFVLPTDEVTDYRTNYSGITPELLKNGKDFNEVQNEVKEILKDKVIIGHSLKFDFKSLKLKFPSKTLRDTALYLPIKQYYLEHPENKTKNKQFGLKLKSPSLKFLGQHLLGIKGFQEDNGMGHNSIDDSRVSMLIYRKFKKEWENFCNAGLTNGKISNNT
ncbi:3'-5' exonuclease [Lobulomyces angularis]|nr:3'-5' exonuclease [Lobulomyces angularis]